MNLNDLRYFALIVEHGGYTAAERITHVHRSKLSRRIAHLEEVLGVRLLQRSTRRLALTEAGQVFYEHCAAMVIEAEAAREAIEMLRSEPVGTVRMSCPVVLAQLYLAKLIADFMVANPKVRVELNATDHIVNLIEDRIDIALRVQTSVFDDPGIVERKVATGQFILVASPNYMAMKKNIDTLENLAGHETIGALQQGPEQTWVLTHTDQRVEKTVVRPRMLCSDLSVQHQAAISGVGVALLPKRIASSGIKFGALIHVAQGWSTPEENINLVYSTRRGLLPSVRSLIDYLVNKLPAALGE